MSEPPKFYQEAKAEYPAVFAHYEALSNEARRAGPLDDRTAALVKLAISIGAGLEGATHSAVRKGLASGCDASELRHIALLGMTTLGFPSAMRARAWVEDVLSDKEP